MFLIEEEFFELGEYDEKGRNDLREYIRKQKQFYNICPFRNDLVFNENIFQAGFLLFRCGKEECCDYFQICDMLKFDWGKNFLVYLQINELYIALDSIEIAGQQNEITFWEEDNSIRLMDVKHYLSIGSNSLLFVLAGCSHYINNNVAHLYFLKLAAAFGHHGAAEQLYSLTKSKKYLEIIDKLNTKNKKMHLGDFYYENGMIREFKQFFIQEAAEGCQYCASRLVCHYFYNEKDYDEALKYLKMMKDDSETWKFSLMFEIYNSRGNIEKALKKLKKGAFLGDPLCLNNLGNYYLVNGNLGQATLNYMYRGESYM